MPRFVFCLLMSAALVSVSLGQLPLLPPRELPKLGDQPKLKSARQALANARTSLPNGNKHRKRIEQQFKLSNAFQVLWDTKQHPLRTEGDQLLALLRIFDGKRESLDKERSEYEKEVTAYEGTPITDDNRSQMQSWRSRLDARQARGNETRAVLEKERLELVEKIGSYSQRTDAKMVAWDRELDLFIAYANAGVRVGKLEELIEKAERQIKMDRLALERITSSMPGFYKDIEGMATQAESTRESGAEQAVGLGISLAADATTINNLNKEIVSRAQIKALKTAMINYGIRPEHVKKAMGGLDGTEMIKSTRSAREMIESLSQLMDFAGALDQATKQKYWEALAAALSIFIKHPVLKLIKTNVEVYTNLLYMGLSYSLAKARVEQFSKLSESQLNAIDRLRMVYTKHWKELKNLRDERERIKIEQGF